MAARTRVDKKIGRLTAAETQHNKRFQTRIKISMTVSAPHWIEFCGSDKSAPFPSSRVQRYFRLFLVLMVNCALEDDRDPAFSAKYCLAPRKAISLFAQASPCKYCHRLAAARGGEHLAKKFGIALSTSPLLNEENLRNMLRQEMACIPRANNEKFKFASYDECNVIAFFSVGI